MTSNYDVLNLEKISENPYCPHGPTIVFTNGKKSFYACSACRDHKLCNFYLEYENDKTISEEKIKNWLSRYKASLKPMEYYDNLRKKVFNLGTEERKYCQNCNTFIFETDENTHSKHQIITNITNQMLKNPIRKILAPVELNSANAQFVFDEQTSKFILDHIKKFEYDSILCIGAPSVFESLSDLDINHMLLDIDDRFMLFNDGEKFQKFNMFNNHFFNDKKKYELFLSKAKNLLILMDPPYGGIVRLISNTLNSIIEDYGHKKYSVFLVYPYFIENWIKKWLPDYNMLDYKVSYMNQKNFSQKSNLKKGSPARFFTNISLDKIELPKNEGYYFCDACKKYTYEENIHCSQCNVCPSKDGFYYKHCKICNRCVKSAYIHCNKCKQCHLEDTTCDGTNESIAHKKRRLELNLNNKNKKFKK
ncbi:unnamed protein product [Brachionus calyciflorus]|uniref:CTCHY-type domain-containing protein n=1 Tax=Brachionus calyciflorus TaxID=104777 RepID=A0A813YUT5_9BILA|nr:unnamed protein product [Brachionus calyciflorus]